MGHSDAHVMNKTLIISNVTIFCCPRIISCVPLCGVYSPFSGGLLSDSSFLYRHQPADIQYFARTHQASASPQKSSIIWTCSLQSKWSQPFRLALAFIRCQVHQAERGVWDTWNANQQSFPRLCLYVQVSSYALGKNIFPDICFYQHLSQVSDTHNHGIIQ